jgi:dTDP-4-dehydrorhamnose reductase
MMITGATGFLGQHLMLATEAARWEVLAPSSGSMDVRSHVRVLDEITTWKPDVVVHLAYRKADRQVIVDGTRNVAEAAAAAGARMIHFSTDMVFAGREQAYVEADRPDATIDYGRWKAEAETVLLRAHPGALAVRTSLLYGTEVQSAGQRELADVLGGRASTRYFTDEIRCPAHAADVSAAIVTLADQQGSGVLHIAGPEAVSRAQMAWAFAEWMGADPRQVPTASLAETRIDRPAHVVLDTSLANSLGIRCRSLAETLAR